mgnify:CR=1 FL=1
MTKVKKIPDKIPKRYFKVSDSIFHQTIHILLNHTAEQYVQFLNRLKVKDVIDKTFDDFAGFTTAIEITDKPTEWVIYVKEFEWTIKNQGTLIHEIVHAVIRIWQHNNIPYNADTQEFLAHSIANLYEDITRKLLVKKK